MAKKEIIQEQKIIDNIRALGIDMIDNAGSGHPGIVLGAAPIIYTLFTRHININANDDKWLNRDRFIMSAGHGSALLYSILFMAGYSVTIDDLKGFRRIGTKTPGHPEYGVTPGVEITTGPLGQGFASAVGIAMAESILTSKFNIKKKGVFEANRKLFDYHTYVLCSDGDLMEGISYEAASLAGTFKLGKLIVLYDSNNISLDGKTDNVFNENIVKRFEALGWNTSIVNDGNNINMIDKAIARAKKSEKPSIIEIKTIIGYGSIKAGKNAVHGSPLSKEDVAQLKSKWGIRDIPFAVSKEAVEVFRDMISKRIRKRYEKWTEDYKYFMAEMPEELKTELELLSKSKLGIDINLPKLMWQFDQNLLEPMRETNGKVMNVIADNLSNFMGGNADVASSTKSFLTKYPLYSSKSYGGRNIAFGVREHAMGAILNGLAVSGFRVFGSTFLAFADYIKPAIRLSALMKLPVTYIFTHDSINIGSDGPTHQPIEQLAMLRSIPDFDVYRPADAKEIVGAWNSILKSSHPSALIISRNEAPLLAKSDSDMVDKGAYIIKKEAHRFSGTIIATGTEVETALKIGEHMLSKGTDLRIVTMPCVEKFLNQPKEYQEALVPIGYKTIVIEAGSSLGWHRFVYNEKYLMTIDKFGTSGTKEQVMKYCEFDIDTLIKKIEQLFK